MNWLTIATGILALAGAPGAVAKDITPAASAAKDTTSVINMQREQSSRMMVPVTIMGEGPFHFLIDTGSQATAIARDLADRLGLTDRSPATVVAMASRRLVETAVVPGFELGKHSATIGAAPLLERANISGADGILGLDMLQDQRVLIDFSANTMELVSAGQLHTKSGYEIVVRAKRKLGQLIITHARLNNVPVALIVDTGAESSIGNLQLLDRLKSQDADGEALLTDVNGVNKSGRWHTGNRLNLGRINLNNFPIIFANSPSFKALGLEDKPALILGMSQLRAFKRVIIDFPARRVVFDLPASVQRDPWAQDGTFFGRF